jgi:hypothetical protein
VDKVRQEVWVAGWESAGGVSAVDAQPPWFAVDLDLGEVV